MPGILLRIICWIKRRQILFNIVCTKMWKATVLKYLFLFRGIVSKWLWEYNDNRYLYLKNALVVNDLYCIPSLKELTINKLIAITFIHGL